MLYCVLGRLEAHVEVQEEQEGAVTHNHPVTEGMLYCVLGRLEAHVEVQEEQEGALTHNHPVMECTTKVWNTVCWGG